MTERTKTIKGLISGQVDMGTFGLVELELLAIEKENEALRKHAVSGRSELLLAFVEHIKKDNELTETVNANDVEAFLKSQQ